MSNKNLKTYHKKRDYKKTNEPKGERKSNDSKKQFVIQKHDASHLHYDFRLQVGDVLASWVIPKGFSTAANEKRLAIRTENHPLDYAKFEGVIPEGEYGAGTVMVWDFGDYELIADEKESDESMEKALESGSLKFRLQGSKIKGGYAMARTSRGNDDEQWVVFKLDDKKADARRNPVSSEPKSALTDRSLEEIKKEESSDE